MRKLATIFLLAFAGISCEKVIDIDLNEEDPQLVVNGMITNRDEPQTVQLSRSNSYFESISSLPPEEGATVKVVDDQGNEFVFAEEEPGMYRNHDLIGELETNYTLHITAQGEEYEASSYLPRAPIMDTSIYFFQEESLFQPEGFYVTNFQTDPVGVGDYYQYRFYQNGSLYDQGQPYLTYEDQFFDGKSVDFTFFQYPVNIGDTIVVELYMLDKVGFDFYNTLEETIQNNDGGPFAGTPQNPQNNLSNGALGYFGAFAVVADTFAIQP